MKKLVQEQLDVTRKLMKALNDAELVKEPFCALERENAGKCGAYSWQKCYEERDEELGRKAKYSESEREYLSDNPLVIDLAFAKSSITRRTDGTIVVMRDFYGDASEAVWCRVLAEIGIHDSLDVLEEDVFDPPLWIEEVLSNKIRECLQDTANLSRRLPVDGEGLDELLQHCLQDRLEEMIIIIRRHRRIEDFLVDLAYFEKNSKQEELIRNAEHGLLSRIMAFYTNAKNIRPSLQPSQKPMTDARLVGNRWPTWTDETIRKNAHLDAFLGIQDKLALDTIGSYLAGYPQVHHVLLHLPYSFEENWRPTPDDRSSLTLLKQIWYGPGMPLSASTSFAWLKTSERLLCNSVPSYESLSNDQKGAIRLIFRSKQV